MCAYISCNPSTGQVVYTRPLQDKNHLSQQVVALRQAQHEWQQKSVADRAVLLTALADQFKRDRGSLATQISLETGRLHTECLAEIDKSIRLIRYYTELAPRFLKAKSVITEASVSEITFEPLGIVFAIMPWNYPIWQVLRFAVPALLTGNACLIKPATSVPQCTEALLKMVQTASINTLDIAWIADDQVEEAMGSIDAVAFTGSAATGRHIAALAGRHLKKTVLELGGSNPLIVFADADIHAAASNACISRFRDAGQSCNAAKRLIVVPAIADAFITIFVEMARQLQCGQTLAPLGRADLRDALHEQVLDAQHQGAQLLLGGHIPSGAGFFYPATVLDHVNASCRVYREEVFGPVASILRATSEEHAIALANDTPFGLGASIYTAEVKKAKQWAKHIQAGSVFINRYTSSDLRLPFGGIKSSGYGRELSEFGLYEFVNIKTYWQK